MIAEQYVTFETAKLLKQAGFGIPVYDFWEYVGEYVECRSDCAANHNKHGHLTSRPTQALAARWLREVHHIYIMPQPILYGWIFDLFDLSKNQYILCGKCADAESYEAALEAALQEAIKMIKSKDYEKDVL